MQVIDTPLRRALSDPQAKSLLDRINADPHIGPDAPADGDLPRWFSMLVLLVVSCSQNVLVQAGVDPVAKTADATDKGGLQLLDLCESLADQVFLSVFPEPSEAQRQSWANLLACLTVEVSIRWGGRNVRIAKRRKLFNVRAKVTSLLRTGTPLEEIPSKVGISRATLYRVLKQK